MRFVTPNSPRRFPRNPGNFSYDNNTGCAGSRESGAKVKIIDNTGSEGNYSPIIPCVDHPTLTDRIEGASLNWRYYANQGNGIWTGPNAIQHICNPVVGNACTGSDFTSHVVAGNNGPGQILKDLGADGLRNCNLQAVSWLIPDGTWSDHGGLDLGYGPAWLSAVVNAVGGVYFDSTGQHSTGCNYWNNTAIFITWDDWGGWYDHIVPPIVPLGSSQFGAGYLYGFRVPLIVVSAYTQAGTISGPVSGYNRATFCLPTQSTSVYCHDFGSILRYTELNFGLPTIDRSTNGGYADKYAMDAQYPGGNIPLQEFFTLTTARQFQVIPGPVPASCFINPNSNCFPGYAGPVDPDNDANENPF